MKKIIVELIKKHYQPIIQNWIGALAIFFKNKLSQAQIRTLVNHFLTTLMEVIETADYSNADQLLIEIYNLCHENGLDLLEVSQIFSNGRFAIINHLEKDTEYEYDPIIILGFIEEIIEQIFARYSVLHQETEMKELELDRDRLKQKLHMNQQYLQNILHSSDSAIMVMDSEDKFIAWNKGAEKIFGYTEEEIIGKTPELFYPNKSEYLEELLEIRKTVRADGFYKTMETERVTKKGSIISIQLNVNVLTDSEGNYAGRSVLVKDYTEVKRLQQQIDQSEKLAVLGQMAAGIAHEIGNPLTSISSIVQILQRRVEEEFTIQQLSTIKENIDRISRIVRELVDFSRPPGYEKSLIQINDIIKTALGIVKYDKRVKEVDFRTNLDNHLPQINIIPDQFLQVLVNILFNALDAIEGRGVIEVNSKIESNYIYIELIDNGCGIENENIDKIFDPFYTTKTVGKGTGLGLSVSYGIINKFNGDIKAESKLNCGTKFTVMLPLENN